MPKLTIQQKESIEKTSGPCVILAGAGTGKTFTIVEKIKHLVSLEKYKPEKIVCITFSNEAANSLSSRINNALKTEDDKKPIIKTFHAFSADLLREHGEKIGIKKDFSILTPDDSKVLLHSQLKVPVMNCHRFVSALGTAKDLGITKEEIDRYLEKKSDKLNTNDLEKKLESLQFELQTAYMQKGKNKKELANKVKDLKQLLNLKKFLASWNAYEKIKDRQNLLDYSDLNKLAFKLLKNNPEISDLYSYLIVDEFQDTNKIQLELIYRLAPHRNITVVGDLNQSIYQFRGAYSKNLDEFKEHFKIKQKEIFNLNKSYRSSNKILKAAHTLITHNYENPSDSFLVQNALNRTGENLSVIELKDSREEARKIVEIVQSEIKNGTPAEEICIMFRNHAYGRLIKNVLEYKSIPFTSISKASLLEQKSIKHIMSYLNILDKLKRKAKGGEQAWWELIYACNLNDDDLVKVGKFIKDNRDSENISAKLLNNLPELKLNTSSKMEIKILLEKIKMMIPFLNEKLSSLLKQVFLISGMAHKTESKLDKEVILNLNRFYELATNHASFYEPDLSSFLHHIDILKDLGINVEAAEIESEGVRLMTLHATKGLEYDTVIITNCAQKRFPMEKTYNNSILPKELFPEFRNIAEEDLDSYIEKHQKINQLKEERRLCYVAFTRARKNLYLTYATKYGEKKFLPSQFLTEINYKQNQDVDFFQDSENKYEEPKVELKPAFNFSTILGKDNFDNHLVELLKSSENKEKKLKKNPVFSPSSLLTFSNCQKKYEYRYIYNMPEEKTLNWEELRLGSFVHLVLETGVKDGFKTENDFLNYADELHQQEDWNSVELPEAKHLIKVFYARNKDKYDKNSKVEQRLSATIEGINFMGFADRIDVDSEGLEIIDYKTGSSVVPPKNRNWQLGFYALAAQNLGKVKKITLDMLKHEKPLEFEVDNNGNAKAIHGRMEFNLEEVKEELVSEAKKVMNAIENGFSACPIEKNCEFCNEYIYGR